MPDLQDTEGAATQPPGPPPGGPTPGAIPPPPPPPSGSGGAVGAVGVEQSAAPSVAEEIVMSVHQSLEDRELRC